MKVTRLLVEYVAGGKKFSVDLDPDEVGTLVLSMSDFNRIRKEIPDNPNEPRPSAGKPLRPQLQGKRHGILKEGTPKAASALDEGDGLWWHVSSCSWFHPS